MSNFKHHERMTAAALGGTRNITNKGQAAADVTHKLFCVECKTKKNVPAWLLGAMTQARRVAQPEQLPIVVIHPHGAPYRDDLVVLRMSDFRDWFGELCDPPADPTEDSHGNALT
jgi:hypothetical protein